MDVTPQDYELTKQALTNVWKEVPKRELLLMTIAQLLLVFSGPILNYVSEQSTSEPFIDSMANTLTWAGPLVGVCTLLFSALAFRELARMEYKRLHAADTKGASHAITQR